MSDPIRVWTFDDAPQELQDVFTYNGGDEDWIAVVPPGYANAYIGWLQDGSPFGCCSVERYRTDEAGNVSWCEVNHTRCEESWKPCDRSLGESWASLEFHVGCHA